MAHIQNYETRISYNKDTNITKFTIISLQIVWRIINVEFDVNSTSSVVRFVSVNVIVGTSYYDCQEELHRIIDIFHKAKTYFITSTTTFIKCCRIKSTGKNSIQ